MIKLACLFVNKALCTSCARLPHEWGLGSHQGLGAEFKKAGYQYLIRTTWKTLKSPTRGALPTIICILSRIEI